MNEDKSKIDNLNSSLYSRTAPDIRTKRHLTYEEQNTNVETDWQHDTDVPGENIHNKNNSMSFLTKILIASIMFFMIALGIGAFLLFNGSNIVSPNNVDIMINGPVSVAAGEPATFEIQVINHNNITLEKINLSVDFPTGTTEAQDTLRELKNIKESLANIAPGGVGQKTVRAVLFGEENSKKEIKVSIQYRVKGSNATALKEKTFDLLISTSPLSLSVSSFKEVNSNQEFEMTVVLNSNSKEVIKNLLVRATYPFGYSYISSDVKTGSSNNVWKIGDIPPGSKKTIKIKGKLEGQDDEVRIFRFSAGSARLGSDSLIATEYITGSREVSIKKPFMTVGMVFNGDDSPDGFIANFNNSVRVDISYFNNLPTPIVGGEIRVKLSGSAFDKLAVSSDQGLYSSLNNEIVWNGNTTPDLGAIEGGGSGIVSFNVTPKNLSSVGKSIINPDLKFDVSVKGKRTSESNVPENIVSTLQKDIKVSSNISLGGQILRSGSPFTNTGPIPPHVEQPSTYTVVWTVNNTSNSVSNARIHASLPAYVKWLDAINPTTEDITYDSISGDIVWNVGSVGTYTAGTTKRKQVMFQIVFNPILNQIGNIPVLVNQAVLTAQDDFTGETLKSNLGTLTTRFSTDPTFKDGDDKVVN